MAQVNNIICKKIKSSTILEVVISMVVIVFVIGVAFMILANVMRLNLSAQKLKTSAFLQSELSEISAEENIRDTSFMLNDISIQKTVKKSDFGDKLYIVYLKATDRNAVVVSEIKGIVVKDHDQ